MAAEATLPGACCMAAEATLPGACYMAAVATLPGGRADCALVFQPQECMSATKPGSMRTFGHARQK